MSTIFSDVIDINGVTFNDNNDRPAGSGYWRVDQLEGWNSRPAMEFQLSPISGVVDGEAVSPYNPLKARHLVVGGYVTADDRATAETLKDVLWGDVFPRNTEFTIVRQEPVPKFLTVRYSGDGDIAHVGPYTFRWQAAVVAADPFKYGLTALTGMSGAAGHSTGGRTYPRTFPMTYGTTTAGEGNAITLVNAGNTWSSKLVLTITGPLANGGWRVSNETTGEDISFAIDVASTDVLTIDFEKGTALLNNYPVGAALSGDFWKLKRGANVIKLFADYNASVSMSATGYSAWE
jgi:hypothetical protein